MPLYPPTAAAAVPAVGESEKKINAARVVGLLQQAGAAAVIIHGRTMEQRYLVGQLLRNHCALLQCQSSIYAVGLVEACLKSTVTTAWFVARVHLLTTRQEHVPPAQ